MKLTQEELIEIVKGDIDMATKALKGVPNRFKVEGDLEFEDARGWLIHAMDVIRYWEKQK